MLDFDLVKLILIGGIASSIITTATIQKVKEFLPKKSYIKYASLIVSLVIGKLFAYCFCELSIINCIWCGLLSWIGAEAIFKIFEDKIFTPFSKMNETISIPKENEIKSEEK